ncbi:Protein jim lovell [Eumeta japonica]|uniref:Protein jim lovell n=1 Tax=Eumeta variegata TaxID=151549 RepID=A0A4C1UVW6_EUMVA|nr:Protein jim lovell [Eumeta japonica]
MTQSFLHQTLSIRYPTPTQEAGNALVTPRIIRRPKGQHSAPRGGPPRSWTNAELTEALQHVWNKKMTTSQASRIFGIPYNSLLMYVRGKYGKSLKLEQLRKDCTGPGGGGGGGPLDSLVPPPNNNNNHPPKHPDKDEPGGTRPASSEPDIGAPIFNPFSQAFYPEFPGGFPMPLNMLHLLPPGDKGRDLYQTVPLALDALSAAKDEDCKSDRSKENSADEEGEGRDFRGHPHPPHPPHPPDAMRALLHHNGQD